MDVSVVIVNYNVKHFLEQVILSVQNASKNLDVELLIVDNNSVDGSTEMMETKFPDITYIKNEKNVGFSKANNQAMRIAKGKYILLLNPDTIIEEDTLEKVFDFMEKTPDSGAVGCKLIDGAGNFHRESKRALPTPEVSFYKMIGLSKIFSKSEKFGQYYLTHLPEDEINEVEILAGCFMFMRKEALDKVGLLDEDFFMYGEDIDLSYRIIKGGYKNYYFPETRIIHYKGESTKKKNFNYVKVFYNAMIIFFDKHFKTTKKDRLFAGIIKMAIYARASVALLSTWIKDLSHSILDSLLIYGGMYGITDYWEKNHRYIEGGEYPDEYLSIFVPIYILIWISSIFFSGGYDKPQKLNKILKGLVVGTVIIAVLYGFLEESLRFSRALILLGAVWASFITIFWRIIKNIIKTKSFDLFQNKSKRVIIVGQKDEVIRIKNLIDKLHINLNLIGFVSNDQWDEKGQIYLGKIHQLDEAVELYDIEEIIFSGKDMSSQEIMDWITKLGSKIEYKIVPEDSWSIIGSHSSNKAGELYTIDIELGINKVENKRSKRTFDLIASIFLLALSPLLIIISKKPTGLLSNILKVLLNLKTWVGYTSEGNLNLPQLKANILPTYNINKDIELEHKHRLDFLYAKDYSVWIDFEILMRNLRNLGN